MWGNMSRKNSSENPGPLQEAIARLRSEAQSVRQEVTQTSDDLRGMGREAIPHPIMRRVQKRVDEVLEGRRRRRR